MEMQFGNKLTAEDQKHCLAAFVYRFTGDHRPHWATKIWKDGKTYPLQFADDQDWLAHAQFAVKKNGRLDQRAKFCECSPTWPHNPELRRK